MNKADLLKIILAAVAGAVAKEVIAWLLKRTGPVGSSAIAWLKNHPRYIGLAIEAAVLIFGFWILFTGDDSKPATRADVRTTAIFVVILFAILEQFGRHIREVRHLYKSPGNSQS